MHYLSSHDIRLCYAIRKWCLAPLAITTTTRHHTQYWFKAPTISSVHVHEPQVLPSVHVQEPPVLPLVHVQGPPLPVCNRIRSTNHLAQAPKGILFLFLTLVSRRSVVGGAPSLLYALNLTICIGVSTSSFSKSAGSGRAEVSALSNVYCWIQFSIGTGFADWSNKRK